MISSTRANGQPIRSDLLDQLGPGGRTIRVSRGGRGHVQLRLCLLSAKARWAPAGNWSGGAACWSPWLCLFTHPGRHLLVGQAELIDQLLMMHGRFFQGVEVLTVQILDQSLLQAAPRPPCRAGTSTGMVCNPARRAARQRRSPQ